MKIGLFKDESVLVFQPELAQLLGLSEAIILNQIHYWLDNGIKTKEAAEKFMDNYKKYKGDRINGCSRRKHWEDKYNHSKTSPKDSKWAGYKPPRGNHPANIHIEGLI